MAWLHAANHDDPTKLIDSGALTFDVSAQVRALPPLSRTRREKVRPGIQVCVWTERSAAEQQNGAVKIYGGGAGPSEVETRRVFPLPIARDANRMRRRRGIAVLIQHVDADRVRAADTVGVRSLCSGRTGQTRIDRTVVLPIDLECKQIGRRGRIGAGRADCQRKLLCALYE